MSVASSRSVVDEVRDLCATAEHIVAGGPLEAQVAAIRDHLDGPIRIAIAGRIKAGKSTLLNALVGERLAATDAGECTKVITTYRHASGYEVAAELHDGTVQPLRFAREDGALKVDLGDLEPELVKQIDVGWPARVLKEMTLIDTPGLASLNDENSQRTRAFLDSGRTNPAGADAVLYLMRHLHRADSEFLGSFMDRTVAGASPVNALAVLSRADEIGACRLDAMESASRIAARYESDSAVRTLVGSVLPVAGLLAQTGLTLHEHEYQALAELAALPEDDRDRLCLSVDYFCDVSLSPLTAEIRRDLVDRLGMFGLRHALQAISKGTVNSSSDLSRNLVDVSGLTALQSSISEQFLPRARLLQARTGLAGLRGVAVALAQTDSQSASSFASELDRIDAGAAEFAMLQAAHLVLSGSVKLDDEASAQVAALLDASDLSGALGLTGLSGDDQRQQVLNGLSRWRGLTSDPLANSLTIAVAETMSRLFERAFAEL